MKKLYARLKRAAASPLARPVEVWAVRAAYAYLAVKLGIAADHAVTK